MHMDPDYLLEIVHAVKYPFNAQLDRLQVLVDV